jgi:hypothetical protein
MTAKDSTLIIPRCGLGWGGFALGHQNATKSNLSRSSYAQYKSMK